MRAVLSNTQIWAAPCVLGTTSAVGLIAALLADRVGDAVSWIALAAPVVVSLRGLWRPRPSRKRRWIAGMGSSQPRPGSDV